jgi:hypothetical protein
MESEQTQNFNERLSHWVASQGFWFQLRYSMVGTGLKGVALFQFLKMSFRLLIFAVFVSVGLFYYLVKRTTYKSFGVELKNSLQSGFSAKDIKIKGYAQNQGQLEIQGIACEGGAETFFTSFDAKNIRLKMNLLDGMVGHWDPKVILVSRLDIELRAGADDAESARNFSKAFFKKFPKVSVDSFEVADATITWGYSDSTRGSITNSMMRVQRLEDSTTLIFTGGLFEQNWLRNLEIVRLVARCDAEGVYFEKAEFRRGAGTVDLTGLKVVGGERPAVDGVAKVRQLGLDVVLTPLLRNFVEGSFSSDFRVSGSTNTSAGVGFAGQVVLDGKDVIALRRRVHLLQALSDVDYVRNYYRVDFREGSFQMKTTGGGMEITDLNLKADDLFTLEGKMLVRRPTPEESQESLKNGSGDINSPLFDEEGSELDVGVDDFKLPLKRAALQQKRSNDAKSGAGANSPLDRLGLSLEMRKLQEKAAERLSKTLRYEGLFRVTLPPDAFELAPKLVAKFPVDPKLGRIPIEVPIEGRIFELTFKQAEEVYQMRSR